MLKTALVKLEWMYLVKRHLPNKDNNSHYCLNKLLIFVSDFLTNGLYSCDAYPDLIMRLNQKGNCWDNIVCKFFGKKYEISGIPYLKII